MIKKFGFIIICLISFMAPNFIVKIDLLNYAFIGLALICLFALIIRTYRNCIKLDWVIFILLLWRILVLIPTLINSGEVVKWGYQTIVFSGLYLLIHNYRKDQILLKGIYYVLFSYLLINLVVQLLFPKGIFPAYGIYFLGIRTRFTEFSIALLYFAIINFLSIQERGRKDIFKLLISIAVSLANVLMQWIATGIVVIAVILVMYLLFNKTKYSKFIYVSLTFVLFVLTILLIFGNLMSSFSWLFEMLNKDVTLTGRTIIWNNAVDLIKEKIYLGYGYVDDGNIVPYKFGYWQAHNTMLQSLCECGIFGTCFFYIFFISRGYCKVNFIRNSKIVLSVCVMLGLMIMMITEIIYYYPVIIMLVMMIGSIINNEVEENDQN